MKIDYGRRGKDAVHNSSFIGKRALIIIFLLLPLPAFLISMTIGTFPITIWEIGGVILSRLGFDMGHPSVYETVIFQVRLPRVLLAMMVGSALSAPTSSASPPGLPSGLPSPWGWSPGFRCSFPLSSSASSPWPSPTPWPGPKGGLRSSLWSYQE